MFLIDQICQKVSNIFSSKFKLKIFQSSWLELVQQVLKLFFSQNFCGNHVNMYSQTFLHHLGEHVLYLSQ